MTPPKQRILLVSIGEAGHAFPAIAIASRLAAVGHEVAIHTWFHWEDHIRGVGAEFFRAPKFEVAADQRVPSVHEAAALATGQLREVVDAWQPDVIVGDVLTLASSLTAELCGVPFVTFVPHFWHATGDDAVPFGSGWAPAESRLTKRLFKYMHRFERAGLEYGRDELNETRSAVGLAPIDRVHGALSRELILVGTLPQLEPTRGWPEHVRVVGPVMWEPEPAQATIPEGNEPLVVVAPSTAQDLDHTMLHAAVEGLKDLPIRVIAAKNGREPLTPLKPGPRTTVLDWAPYSRLFPHADAVLCHGGHGTIMRALTSGAPVVVTPASGDQYENGARVRWAKVGVSIPNRFISSRTIAAGVEKLLTNRDYKLRARALAEWSADHDAAQTAANQILAYAHAKRR